jgi:hypothetical protein
MPAPGVAWYYHRARPKTWTRVPGFTGPVCMQAQGLLPIMRANHNRLIILKTALADECGDALLNTWAIGNKGG